MTITTSCPTQSPIQTDKGGSSTAGTYQVLRETVDILFDYADTEVRSVHKSLAEANEAAKKDLLSEYSLGELDEYEEVIGSDGGVCISTSTPEVDLTISVRHISPPHHPHHPHHPHRRPQATEENYVYTITRTDSSSTKHSTTFLGVYRSEDTANEVAERELRRAAGIRNWRDRRRFRGGFREVYGLNGCFEGVASVLKGAGEDEDGRSAREEVAVVVERRVLV